MSVPDRYQRKDSWPHGFTRTTETKQVSETAKGILYYCTYCNIKWWNGLEPRPLNNCPARTDKSEYTRLGVDLPK